MYVPKVLTVAGSDCSGGAGIQADIKTITALGCYAMSVITSVTCQNTTGVTDIFPLPPDIVRKQIESVFTDIMPDAVKTGMFSSPEDVKYIADAVKKYRPKYLVADPVMTSTSGADLGSDGVVRAMEEYLFPLASVITPNLTETERLSGMKADTPLNTERAAEKIYGLFSCPVLCKGGDRAGGADDFLVTGDGGTWIRGERIMNPNTHGTGCTLSSAIASYLALGNTLEESVRKAKGYVSGAIAFGLDIGKGRGPLYHAYTVKNTENR